MKWKKVNDRIDSNGEITETYFYNGYIGLKGPYVEHCAKNNIDDVSKIYLENRVRRDGREHHITILSKSEISMLMDMNSKSKSQTKEYVQELLTKLQSVFILCFFFVIIWNTDNII